ncbi:MAG: sodium/glutamate symporter, partial [Pseudomonadota bacterium]
ATGFAAAAEIGVAAATLGLILAAVLGGPIAKHLIERKDLQPGANNADIVGLPHDEKAPAAAITHVSLMRAMLAAHVAVILGWMANQAIAETGLKLPLFVPCLFVGIVMSNTIPMLAPSLPWPARTKALALLSDYCLSVFLAMSLMSLQLWTLASLGGPLLAVLLAQAAVTAAFILFVFFRVMGGGFDSAVLSAGFAGFGLGATPTAIANMSAVAKRYGPAPIAFIILPLVSAFFVDLANALIIQVFLWL